MTTTIDVLGKPCPIPVIEAKKALAEQNGESVLVKTDNVAAVKNLEKMAKGYGYGFSYDQKARDFYEVIITREKKSVPETEKSVLTNEFGIVISRNTMGNGSEELGKILIKGFIYSLTELTTPPKYVIFLNSGAYLTSNEANTVDDLKKLEQNGTEILTCGTCVNYYGLQDKTAVGAVTDMYGITERMVSVGNVINI